MTGKPINLHDRAMRTDAVLSRFRDRAFDWKGGATCVHLARAQLAAMGNAPRPMPQFRSSLGARKALAKLGFATLEALFDSTLPRIAPAAMWVGDLALLPGEDGFEAVTIAVNGFVVGWHGDDLTRMHAIEVSQSDIRAAWRVG
jgi:hypothetical protein